MSLLYKKRREGTVLHFYGFVFWLAEGVDSGTSRIKGIVFVDSKERANRIQYTHTHDSPINLQILISVHRVGSGQTVVSIQRIGIGTCHVVSVSHVDVVSFLSTNSSQNGTDSDSSNDNCSQDTSSDTSSLCSVDGNTRLSITIANTTFVDLSARVLLDVAALGLSAGSDVAVTLEFGETGVRSTVTCYELAAQNRVAKVCGADEGIVADNGSVVASSSGDASVSCASILVVTVASLVDRDVIASNYNSGSGIGNLRAEIGCASVVVVAVQRRILASVESWVTRVNGARIVIVTINRLGFTNTISRVTFVGGTRNGVADNNLRVLASVTVHRCVDTSSVVVTRVSKADITVITVLGLVLATNSRIARGSQALSRRSADKCRVLASRGRVTSIGGTGIVIVARVGRVRATSSVHSGIAIVIGTRVRIVAR